MSKLLFGRIVKVTIDNKKYKGTFDYKDLEIHFEVPFDDDSKPNITRVDIYNLGRSTISKISKGSTMTVQAGYKDDYGVLAIGKVTKVLTSREGVDKITSIFMKEGDDYSHIKVSPKDADAPEQYKSGKNKGKNKKQVMRITFKAGTTARTIINRLVKILGIKLAKLDLPKNKVYKKGFVVTGSIEKKLLTVVKDCGAAMYWRRGKMVIRSIKKGDDERFKLEEATGLVDSPEPFEDENIKGYKVKCLLQHRITTASIITISSKTAKGKYRAKQGKHYFDGNDFFTEFDAI